MSKPTDLSESKILASLSLIERYIPRKKEWTFYEPTREFDPKDIVSVQKEAKKMMDFVGLNGYTTLVTYESCAEGTAGNINLNKDTVVFINISRTLFDRPHFRDAVLGTLAHEICHKLLYTRDLYLSNTTANEITTDLCTIYVGFGLLTINGCKDFSKTKKKDETGNTITNTNSYTTGYLTPRAYLFALYIMCSTYKYPFENVRPMVASNVLYDYDVIKYDVTNRIIIPEISKETLKNEFRRQSCDVASIKRDIVVLQTMLDELSARMFPYYQQMDNRFNKLLFSEVISQMPIASIYATIADADSKVKVEALHSIKEKLDSFIKEYDLLDTEKNNAGTLYAQCPFCGARSTTPLNDHKKLILKCKCGKIYYWDATIRELSAPQEKKKRESAPSGNPTKQKTSLWNRLREFFKK